MKKIFTLFAALAMVMSMSATPYLRGGFNGWGTGNEFLNGECTINLTGNTDYEFKVDQNGDWATSYGNATITSSNCSNVKLSSGNNAKITTTLKGAYKFTWNASNKTLTVAYPTEEVVKPKKDITVKAKMPAHWTKTIDAWVWTDEDGNGKAVTPEKDGDWYVITQNTAASYIIFRNGAAWNGDANQTVDMCFEDNACIQLAQSGSSKATYTNIDCVSEFTLTATANPAEGGSVTGAGVYEEGTTVTLTATPNEGYEFVSWTNGGAEVSTNATYSFVIKANLALVANFKAVEATVYTISTEAVNGTVTGAGVYEEGATVTLTATPADGYNFKNWTVSGAEVSAENPYIFTATADVTVTANFEEIPVEYETVYFVNAQDWEKVCIYTWTPEIGTWPGKEMTKEAEQIGGKDVYSYTVEKGTMFGGLNFNNGDNGKQTSDLTWTAGKYYVIDNWYTKEEAEEKLATPVQTYDYYVVGTFNSWTNPDPNHGMTLVGDVYKATVTLNVGANMLKVTNGTWENAKGFSAMGAEYEEVSNDTNDGNILITLTEGKDVVVVYNATTGKVTFEGLTEKVVVTPDVITYVLMGVGGDWTTGIALTANPENANEYVLLGQTISEGDAVKVVTIINGAKTYCGNVDEYSAEHTKDKEGNIVLAPGKYDFYYKVAENIIYIGAVVPELPTYDVTVADATVSTTNFSINLAGTWEDRPVTVMLWQDNVQGFGEYAANAENGYTCQLNNPYADLTPTTTGVYADNGDGTFTFTATMTDADGAIYNITLTGATPAAEPEPQYVDFYATAEFSDNIYVEAEDYTSLDLYFESASYNGVGTYEVSANYMDVNETMHMLYGEVTISYDDVEGTEVLMGDLSTTDGSMNVHVVITKAGSGSVEGTPMEVNVTNLEVNYEPLAFSGTDDMGMFTVSLVPNTNKPIEGKPMTFELDLENSSILYSTGWVSSPLTLVSGEITVDMSAPSATAIVTASLEDQTFVLTINMTAAVSESIDIELEATSAVIDEDVLTLYATYEDEEGNTFPVAVELQGFENVEGPKEYEAEEICKITIGDPDSEVETEFMDIAYANSVAVVIGEGGENSIFLEGEFSSWATGSDYYVTISGTLPGGTTVALDNIDATVAPVKVVENGQLIIIKNGVQYNAQGAVIK